MRNFTVSSSWSSSFCVGTLISVNWKQVASKCSRYYLDFFSARNNIWNVGNFSLNAKKIRRKKNGIFRKVKKCLKMKIHLRFFLQFFTLLQINTFHTYKKRIKNAFNICLGKLNIFHKLLHCNGISFEDSMLKYRLSFLWFQIWDTSFLHSKLEFYEENGMFCDFQLENANFCINIISLSFSIFEISSVDFFLIRKLEITHWLNWFFSVSIDPSPKFKSPVLLPKILIQSKHSLMLT